MPTASAVRPSPVFLGVVALAALGGVIAWNSIPGQPASYVGVFILVVAGWVVSLCLHEFSHAALAWRYGDREVEVRGYLTLNPFRYATPGLSIVLPLIFVAIGGIGLPGGAVWINTAGMTGLQRTRVSLAGPAANAVLAVALLLVVARFGSNGPGAAMWFGLSFLAQLQVIAVVLNMLPVPGLDGYGALEPHLSPKTRQMMAGVGQFGILIVIALLFVPALNRAFFGLVDAIYDLSGVPSLWAAYGSALTRFWTRF